MTPFELINTERYRDSPFSVPCPHCGSVATYEKGNTKTYPTHASQIAVVFGGAEPDVYCGTVFGVCRCNNRECQEYVYFIGSYVTERDDFGDPPGYVQKFVIKCFFPAVPLIKIPPAAPKTVASLLRRSFALAFMDQSASGNLLRSSLETLLTEERVPRFVTSKGERKQLMLHARIGQLPPAFASYKDGLLAIKWIGNAASHTGLTVGNLKVAFDILEHLLEGLYGTRKRELERAIKLINRRKKP